MSQVYKAAFLPIDIPGLQVRPLQPSDAPSVQALFERCHNFFLLVDGRLPSPHSGHTLFTELPPGKTLADKVVFGIVQSQPGQDGSILDGVLEAIFGYPLEGDWWVGLLLLAQQARRRGLGRSGYQEFEAWAASQGVGRVLLGVVEENVQAYKFWTGLGFELLEKRRF